MSLSSLDLDAFLAVAQTQGFSAAAKKLGLTQSALSQRVKNLENDLGLTLFIRTPVGATLNESGERLLRYCQTRDSIEEELIQELNGSKTFEMSGRVRIAAYSSVLRSVLIPALKPLLTQYPQLLCEFICADMEALPGMLKRTEVDFIVMDYELKRSNLKTHALGTEKFVIIESKQENGRSDVFLDNHSRDRATEVFFKSQTTARVPKYRRSYFDDCYGIIEGVELGLGKAVMSEHLVAQNPKLKFPKGYKAYPLPVVLHFYQQAFYSKLHHSVTQCLIQNSPKLLSAPVR